MAQVNESDRIYRLQGQVGAIREILDLVEGAESIMARMNASRKNGEFTTCSSRPYRTGQTVESALESVVGAKEKKRWH